MKMALVRTGQMGSALASAMLEKRFEVAVWNRTRARCLPLVEQHLPEIVCDQGLDDALPEAMDGLFGRAIGLGYLEDDFAVPVPLVAKRA